MERWKGIRTEKQDRSGDLIYEVEQEVEQVMMCSCYYGARVLPTCKCLPLVHLHAFFFFFHFKQYNI